MLLFNALRGHGFGLISIRLLRLRYCLLLFYLLFCVRLFPLFIWSLHKLDGNCVQLVVLVAIGTARPRGMRSVWVIVLVIWFSRVCTHVAYFCLCLGSFHHDLSNLSCWLLWLMLLLLCCGTFPCFVCICYD